jgi:hypothetical protein
MKIVENKYVDFLTNEWKTVLRQESITNISDSLLISFPYSNHVQYLYILKTKDTKQNKQTYTYFTTQFLFFKDLIKDQFGDINTVGVHPEI